MQLSYENLGIILAVIAHGAGSIWWASKINTTIQFQAVSLREIADAIKIHEATKYNKEEAVKDFAARDQQIKALWDRYDKISVG